MKTNFKIYKSCDQHKVVCGEIESLQIDFGCDGFLHALYISRLTRNSNGEVVARKSLGGLHVGKCDGSCRNVDHDGGFLL